MDTIEIFKKAFKIFTGFVYIHNQNNSETLGLTIKYGSAAIDISSLKLIISDEAMLWP